MTSLKNLERWGRRTSAVLIPAASPNGDEVLLSDPSSILVIRTDNRLGNLVLLEPLLRSIRNRFPGIELDILASNVFSELLDYQGYNVIKVDKKGQIRNPVRFINLIRKLRSKSYDVAIDAAHPHSFSLSGALSTVLSGADCRISTDAGGSSGWYTETIPEPPLDWHESRALQALGSVWDNWPAWSPPEIHTRDKKNRNIAGLHVGASGNKKYSLEFLDVLVDKICRKVILEVYWGSAEEKKIAEYLGEKYPVAVMPSLSVEELVEKIAGLRLFITADNGPMHIASAVSVPVIALFRVDNADRFAPLSEGSIVLYAEEGLLPEKVAAAIYGALEYY